MELVNLLVTVLILCIIAGVVYWGIGQLPIAPPFKSWAYAILALIVVIYLLCVLLGAAPMFPIRR